MGLTIPKYKYQAAVVPFGGRLTGKDDTYRIKVADQTFTISNSQYLQIQRQDGQVMCVVTSHSGGYYLPIKFYKQGFVTGNEQFGHFDQSTHHDAYRLEAEIPPLEADLAEHKKVVMHLGEDQKTNPPVNEGNYITALARVFPQMELRFLHRQYRPTIASAAENRYESEQVFAGSHNIHNHSWRLAPGSISSLDLDIYVESTPASCPGYSRGEYEDPAIVDANIKKSMKKSKLHMLFTSPGCPKDNEQMEHHAADFTGWFIGM